MIWHLSALFLGVIVLFGIYSYINFDTYEDSIWLKPAFDLLEGKVLFRETFTPYGMLVPLLQAGALRLFGSYLLVLRLQAVLFYAVTAVMLFLIWRRFFSDWICYAAVMLWLVLAPVYTHILLPWASIYALVFQCLALWSILRFIESSQRRYMVLVGSMAVLTFFARQSVGLFLVLAVGIWLVVVAIKKKQFWMLFDSTFGAVLTILPFALYLTFYHAWPDWWVQSFVFTREYARVIRGISLEQVGKSLLVGSSWKFHTYHLTLIWVAIPLSMFGYLVRPVRRILHRNWSQRTQRFFIVALVCLASWMQYYPMAEPVHFFWAITPMVGFFLGGVVDIFQLKKNRYMAVFQWGIFVLLTLLIMMQVYTSAYRFALARIDAVHFPFLKGIKISSYENAQINSLRTAIKNNLAPNQTYINISEDAMIPLIFPKQFVAIGPYYEQWNFLTTSIDPQNYRNTRDYIDKKRPLIISRTLPYIANYCTLAHVEYSQRFTDVHVPIESVVLDKLPIVQTQNVLSLPQSFSIPDVKKVRFVDGRSAKRGYTILTFKNAYIKQCTIDSRSL